MADIKWLFFDMGSTLIDETQGSIGWFRSASDAVCGALSAEEIEKEYCAGMVNGNPSIAEHLKPYGFTGNSTTHLYPSELDKPYPETEEVLKQLSKKYKLGVIANQAPGSKERLASYRLSQYFHIIIASAEVGFAKPNPRIFELALKEANCKPNQAAMIGDRPDNDIFPAKALGLATVRILQGYAKLQEPKTPSYQADFTISSLSDLLNIF